MAVRSEELKNGKPTEEKRRRPTPAVFPRRGVIGAAIGILRVIAVLLLLASAFGNYVQFVGGWPIVWPLNAVVIGFAILYQVIFSVLQWGFKAAGWWVPYALALLASAVPSFLTYNGLFGPYLALQVGALPAMIGIGIAVLGGDALPEWVLVE